MNELSINIHSENYLSYCWEEIKRTIKNFVKTYREILYGVSINEPAEKSSRATAPTEELPKYLWI